MPVYVHKDRYGQVQWKVYATGSRLTPHQKNAIIHDRNPKWNWYHDSFLPPLKDFAWIVPLHIAFLFFLYMTIAAETESGHIWMGALSLLGLIGPVLFWRHLYYNRVVQQLHKHTIVLNIGGKIGDDKRLYDLASSMRRPDGFDKWFYAQLYENAWHFGAVHVITDEYLRSIEQAYQLKQSLTQYEDKNKLNGLFEKASDIAYEKLRPIYEEYMHEKARLKREEDARIASETTYRKREEKRITAQRIAMAAEDIQTYIEGNQALTNTRKCTATYS